MNIIKQNPYRVLGLLGNASERELQKQIGIIKRFAEIGKFKAFDYDFSFFGDISRGIDDVQHAASKIEQAHRKLHYSLFWFVGQTKFDEIAFNNLKDKNADKAIDVWNKTLKEEVSSKNYSSYHNLSTYYIASSTINGHLKLDYLQKGIELKGSLIHSECLTAYSELVTGNDTSFDSIKISKLFVDEIIEILKPYADENNGVKTKDIISLFDTYPDSIQKYISSSFTEIPLSNIENAIEKSIDNRKISPEKADEYGEELYYSTNRDWDTLKSLLGNDNVQFQMITNKLADEVMQCSISYFNHWTDLGEVDPSKKSLEIAKNALSLVPTGHTRSRIVENSEIMQDWIDDKPNRLKQERIEKDIEYITYKLQEFQEGSNLIASSTNLVSSCKPKLSAIKDELGMYDEFYLQVSSAVANNAIGLLIVIFNEQQALVVQNVVPLATFKDKVSSIIDAINIIETLDMSADIRNRLNINKKTITSTKTQINSHMQKSSGGCYIATMAYGDYNHPQVKILRKYRDDKLSTNVVGRAFIKIYYAVSPHLVKILNNQKITNKVIRYILDLCINNIKS